jgi:hypothetical protein
MLRISRIPGRSFGRLNFAGVQVMEQLAIKPDLLLRGKQMDILHGFLPADGGKPPLA